MADTPKTPQSMGSSEGWFSQAPGGDIDFDAIFTNPDEPQPQPAAQPAPPAQPAPATPKPFLRASTGTVYETEEAAVRGTEEKDRLIAQLRQKFVDERGYDPVTGRPQAQPARPAEPQQVESYLQNPKAFMRDLRDSLARNDEDAFVRTHARFSAEIADARLGPYLPVATDFARNQALGRVSSELPDFNKFLGSDDYTKTLEAFPVLKGAIENAEREPTFYQQLPELYKIAYNASQGRKLPELLKTAPAQQPVQQPVRQTLQSSTLAPTPEAAPQVRTPDDLLKTKEGRKAIIQDFEARYGDAKLTD